jgi:hypothetical protein
MAPVNVDTKYTDSPFEWDAIASKPNVELWAIRVPADVSFILMSQRRAYSRRADKQLKTKHLSSLKISRPSSSSSTLGTLQTRSKTYNLVTAGQTHKVRQAVNSEGRIINAGPSAADVMRMDVDTLDQDDLRREGGEEMEGMTLMVPRFSRKGKLYAGEFASLFRSTILPFPLPFLFRPFLHPTSCITGHIVRSSICRVSSQGHTGAQLTNSTKTIHPTPNPRTRSINNSRTIRQLHINIKHPLIPLHRPNTSHLNPNPSKKGSTHPPAQI